MPIEPKYLAAIKSVARSLLEASISDEPIDGFSYVTTMSGMVLCGVKTREGFLWCHRLEDNGSPIGLKIRAGYEVVEIRDHNFHCLLMKDKACSSSLCAVRLPNGDMKLTTIRGVLDL